MIAEMLKTALYDKGWSISQAASESRVDRSFLSRLTTGKTPPRSRKGRQTADLDDRYRRIARALGLDVEDFIQEVARAQRRAETAAVERALPSLRGQLPDPLVKHFNSLCRSFWNRVREVVPPPDMGGFLTISNVFFAAPMTSGMVCRLEQSIAGLPSYPLAHRLVRSQTLDGFKRRDYLGTPPADQNKAALGRAQLCNDIGGDLVMIDDPPTIRERLDVAGLYFRLSSRKLTDLQQVADHLRKTGGGGLLPSRIDTRR